MFLFQAIQARKMCFTIFQKEETPFQAIRTRTSESRKMEIFPKGLVSPWFQSKIGHFPIYLFWAIYARKMCFTIFQRENMPFQVIKTRSSKSRKIDIFPKGLVYCFGPNLAIFLSFYFRQCRPRICVLQYSRRGKRLSRLSKQDVRKVEKLRFFQRGQSIVLVQNWPFFHLFFQAIQARKMCFMIFQKGKTPFQAIKSRCSKSRKIEFFPKGLVHCFGPNLAIFPRFYFR